MDCRTSSSPYIGQTLRYVEWILLGVSALSELRWFYAIGSPERAFKILAFYSAFALLSWVFPMECPLWQRRGYIFLGILLAVSALGMSLGTSLILYLYIAKGWFLLDRKSVLITIVITGIAATLSEFWSFPGLIQLIHSRGVNVFDPQRSATGFLLNYLAATAFVSAFCLVVLAEQKSRKRAQALAQQVETLATALERTRIARDLHDSLGHTLTNLNSRLAIAQQKLRLQDIDAVSQAVDTAKSLASHCIEDVSLALQTMRQSDFDLNQALTTLVEQMRHNQALSVRWEINLPPLPLSTSYHIYCIVKEGLINIQKHAGASQVRFRGQSTPEGLWLELTDDGQGFEPAMPRSGSGLNGMVERVQMLRGTLTIQSVPGQGTQIQVTIPL